MVVVEVATAELELRPVHGVDPDLGLVEVAGGEAPLAAPHRLDPGDWTRAVTRARLAVGHELVGASRAMVALARSHALERVQFGRPIADFQAVRHRLAETLVAIEATDAALGAAWDEGSPAAAATAKALAGRSARTASLHCQQVLAGIGFTTEHDFHRYARRVLVLDQLFGTARALTRDLGRTLLTDRRLPPLPPL
jgi:alkylation response protein AidB-like acyl-CoA dehydrogenase